MLTGLGRDRGHRLDKRAAAARSSCTFSSDHDLGPAPSGANIANMMFGWAIVE